LNTTPNGPWEQTSRSNQGGGKKNTGHLNTMEISITRATWKSLLDNLYLDKATHNLKQEDEAYKFGSRNPLGGILVFARFFELETKFFAQDPCFLVIALP
jgi:hypothetical protein